MPQAKKLARVKRRRENGRKSKVGAATRSPASVQTQGAPRYIVGIGSSAGGLEALRVLIGGLKHANEICLVIVQHLSPQHRSRLVEIIGSDTPLKVQEITQQEVLRANTIYITPPNAEYGMLFAEYSVINSTFVTKAYIMIAFVLQSVGVV